MSALVDATSSVPNVGSLDFDREGHDWPNRHASRWVTALGRCWHVQVMGRGPTLLLLHGAGAATHSWRDLAPMLAERFTIVAPDLPGHGFSEAADSDAMSLPGMARGVASMLEELALRPDIVVGHSAGAAIAIRLCLSGMIAPRAVVSLNGALLPLSGLAGRVFGIAARVCSQGQLIPSLVARSAAGAGSVERMIENTGSRIDEPGVRFYRRLASCPAHVAATITMMARWDLVALQRDLYRLRPQLTLVVGLNDLTVSPDESRRVQALLPAAERVALPGLGHLAHEEAPQRIQEVIVQAWEDEKNEVSDNE